MDNIILIGMPGCGKSSIAKLLAEQLDRPSIDMDESIVAKIDLDIPKIFECFGEDYFRDVETQVAREVSRLDNHVIATGGGVVTRAKNIDYLKESGTIIFIDRPLENILSDLDTDTRPLLKDNRDRIVDLYNTRYPLYNNYCNIRVINDGTIDEIITDIIGELKDKGWSI